MPDSAAELPTPLGPAALVRLYFRPSVFFQTRMSWDRSPELPLVIYLVGIVGASDRIDRFLMRQDLGRPSLANFALALESWAWFWILIAVGALLN